MEVAASEVDVSDGSALGGSGMSRSRPVVSTTTRVPLDSSSRRSLAGWFVESSGFGSSLAHAPLTIISRMTIAHTMGRFLSVVFTRPSFQASVYREPAGNASRNLTLLATQRILQRQRSVSRVVGTAQKMPLMEIVTSGGVEGEDSTVAQIAARL